MKGFTMLSEQEKNEHRQLSKECLKNDAVRENVDPKKLVRLKQLTEKAKLPAEEKGSAPENQQSSGDNPTPPEKAEEPVKITMLGKIKLDDISKLSLNKLKAICKEEYLPTEADQDVLIKIVRAKKLGGDVQVLRENTLCKYCKYPARIVGSEVKAIFQDKSRTMRYRLKCSGPRTHTFTQIQSEKAIQSKEISKK
jgi:hypothetical protein